MSARLRTGGFETRPYVFASDSPHLPRLGTGGFETRPYAYPLAPRTETGRLVSITPEVAPECPFLAIGESQRVLVVYRPASGFVMMYSRLIARAEKVFKARTTSGTFVGAGFKPARARASPPAASDGSSITIPWT